MKCEYLKGRALLHVPVHVCTVLYMHIMHVHVHVCLLFIHIYRGEKKVICNKIILQVRPLSYVHISFSLNSEFLMPYIFSFQSSSLYLLTPSLSPLSLSLSLLSPLSLSPLSLSTSECCHYPYLACTAANLYIWFS